jgi:hypothetical protein
MTNHPPSTGSAPEPHTIEGITVLDGLAEHAGASGADSATTGRCTVEV